MKKFQLTVQRIGNSLGVVLPVEASEAFKLVEGDRLILTEDSQGLRVTKNSPETAQQMEVAEEGMRKYRNALGELAK